VSSRSRLASTAFVALLAAVLSCAAIALACVPQPLITLHPRASGRPGTKVTVDGLAFPAGDPVEVRWNAVDGPVLARAVGPAISARVTIPKVPAGLYGVVAISRPPDGGVGSSGSAMFEVSTSGGRAAGSAPSSRRASPPASVPRRSTARPSEGRGVGATVLVASGAAMLAIGLVLGFVASTRRRPPPRPEVGA
jgi:hypothetical protein